MKLSEAIRLGAMLRPQAYHSPSDIYDTSSCALVAALEAVTGSIQKAVETYWRVDAEYELFPILRVAVTNPVYAERQESLWSIITILNDIYEWSRERIADFVETVENDSANSVTEGAPFSDDTQIAVVSL